MCARVVSAISFLVVLFASCESCKHGSATSPEVPAIKNQFFIKYFYASPDYIKLGGSANLVWEVDGANSIWIDGGIGDVSGSASGSRNVSPRETTTYTITAKNDDDQVSQTCLLNVDPSNVVMIEGPIFVDGDSSFQYKGIIKNIGTGAPPPVYILQLIIFIHDANNSYSIAEGYGELQKIGLLQPGDVSTWVATFGDSNHSIRDRMDKSKTTYEIRMFHLTFALSLQEAGGG